MDRMRKYITLFLAAMIVIGIVPGQPAAAKEKDSNIVLKINKVTYTKKTCQMVKGTKAVLTVKSGSIKGKKKIKYVSLKPETVSVSKKGRIVAKKKGTAKIKVTVTAGEKKASSWMKIKVVKKVKPPVFNFKKRTVTLNSGYQMPLNGLGTYSLTGDTCVKSVSEALKRGVRLIDTAYMYDNEKEVGKAV